MAVQANGRPRQVKLNLSRQTFDYRPLLHESAPAAHHATELGALFAGDCLDVLPSIRDEVADTVFADPPFNLGKEYGARPRAHLCHGSANGACRGVPNRAGNRRPLGMLWKSVQDRAGVSRAEFDRYYQGLAAGVAIEIASVREFGPYSLDELRTAWEGFHPPQGFRYVDSSALVRLNRKSA